MLKKIIKEGKIKIRKERRELAFSHTLMLN